MGVAVIEENEITSHLDSDTNEPTASRLARVGYANFFPGTSTTLHCQTRGTLWGGFTRLALVGTPH
jgi:hypothetical protein